MSHKLTCFASLVHWPSVVGLGFVFGFLQKTVSRTRAHKPITIITLMNNDTLSVLGQVSSIHFAATFFFFVPDGRVSKPNS